MGKNTEITVLSETVRVQRIEKADFISLTDIAKHKNPDDPRFVIQNWMRTRSSIEFLGIWEVLNNPGFNRVEFDTVRNASGSNTFVMTPSKWIDLTGAIGIFSKAGRYGGTYGHSDIAFEFASWISVEFKLYLIKEFQRLQEAEQKQLGWDVKRNLTRINYRIHTDAIQTHLIPPELTGQQVSLVYASEADVLNMSLFGMTAKQWRVANPGEKGNIRELMLCFSAQLLRNVKGYRERAAMWPRATPERGGHNEIIRQMELHIVGAVREPLLHVGFVMSRGF